MSDEILDTLCRESESDPGIDMAGPGLPPRSLERKKRNLKLRNVLGFALSIICGLITSVLIIVKLFQQVQYVVAFCFPDKKIRPGFKIET